MSVLCRLTLMASFAILCNCNSEAVVTSVEMIRSHGYTCRIYQVTTEDGYMLELHRIGAAQGKRPALLQHGVLGASTDWIIHPTNQPLGYRLADEGYDVWLANARGNIYSRSHVRLNPGRAAYWDFSYDEMGKYDIPAIIQFILKETSQQSLMYIGHSMGTTIFFIAMITHPELNDKIDVMIGLAPVASMAHLKSPIKVLAPHVKSIQKFLRWMGTTSFLSSESWFRHLQRRICRRSFKAMRMCQNALMLITGVDSQHFNASFLSVVESHYPSGTSVNTLAQFAQNFNSRKVGAQQFGSFDRGVVVNLRRYGQIHPPVYNLTRVTAPVHLFWAENDLLATPEDVRWLAGQLGNVKSSVRVDMPEFNHLDFLWGVNNNRLVYDRLLTLLPLP